MKRVVDDCLALDANRLARIGVFGEGRRSSVNWKSGANIGLAYAGGTLELLYDLNGETNDQTVRITKAPCNFGGARYYMHCPACAKRRYKLHLGQSGFYCRECYRLPYYSQQCADIDGITRRVNRLRDKLKSLPKHTRTSTVNGFNAKLQAANEEWDNAVIARFGEVQCRSFGLLSADWL
jgi:hypothetical protein